MSTRTRQTTTGMPATRHGAIETRTAAVARVPSAACRATAGPIMRQPAVAGWQKHTAPPVLGALCCAALIVSVVAARAEEPPAGPGRSERQPALIDAAPAGTSDCRRCHTCDRPTPENPCLSECTRHEVLANAVYVPEYEGPDVIILDAFGGAYLPVPFDHEGHAKMAEMTVGCVACHHYTPAGQPHPACKTCHDVSSADASIRKPGLRGAYHRQCLNCHREWINEKDCAVCHRKRVGSPERGDRMPRLTKDDILAQMHPPVPEPESVVYADNTTQGRGWQVVFDHQEHVRRFGLSCVDCHHEPSCSRCHTREQEQARSGRFTEHHWPCSRCHKRDIGPDGTCERCHRQEGRPPFARFEHAQTGWPLSKFHEGVVCRDCHRSVPFVRLSGDCDSCHSDWDPGTFDHRLTGQLLNEDHAEIDCEVCHVDSRFGQPPKCDACHDVEDTGIAFPARRPGLYPVSESPLRDETRGDRQVEPGPDDERRESGAEPGRPPATRARLPGPTTASPSAP